jgi:hypothetical protein
LSGTSNGGGTRWGDEGPLQFTDHCVLRFRERARPTVPVAEVRRQLLRMQRQSVIVFEPPEWMRDDDPRTWGYWLIGGDDVMPIRHEGEELLCITTLCPGDFPPLHRARKNRNAANRRAGRAARKLVLKKTGKERKRPAPNVSEWAED